MYSDFPPPVFKGTGDKPKALRPQGAVCFENSKQDFSCMIPIGFKLFQKKRNGSIAPAMSELVLLISTHLMQ